MVTKPKFAFIDRDGVVNKKAAEHEYICRVEDFVFNDGIVEMLSRLQNEGFRLVIITNQRGIARGLVSESAVQAIHCHMKNFLEKKGVSIADIFYCPHDIGKCSCRKPAPGMLQKAIEKHKFNKHESIIISDSKDDIDMGLSFGLRHGRLCATDKPLEYKVYE